jgi:CBS-domain-containing membrane protein
MSREVFSVNENQSLLDASKYMEQVNRTGLPVLNDAGKLNGFLSLREIMKGRKNSQMSSPVRAYMIRNVISAPPGVTLREIERLFFRHHIGHLPIVENNALAGIVSRGDYLRGRMRPDSQAGPYPGTRLSAGEPLGRGPGNDLFAGGMDTHTIHTLQNDDTPPLCGGESHFSGTGSSVEIRNAPEE